MGKKVFCSLMQNVDPTAAQLCMPGIIGFDM